MRYAIVIAFLHAWGCASTHADTEGSAESSAAAPSAPQDTSAADAPTAGAAPGSPLPAPNAPAETGTAPAAAAPDLPRRDAAGDAPPAFGATPTSPAPAASESCDGSGNYSGPHWGARCENTESYAQGPHYERVEGATSTQQCLDACSARPDCMAVSDYLQMTPLGACYLQRADCATLSKPDFAEEDGGRTHRKLCDETGDACRFEALADNLGCGDAWETGSPLEEAESTEDCLDACLADPTCTAVRDYFYTQRVPGCYLNTSTCDAPVMSFQDGDLYQKCPD